MAQILVWMLGIAIAAAAMVITAAMELHGIHFALAATIAGFIAVAAIKDHAAAADAGMTPGGLAAVTARYMGMLWAWSAVSIFLTYALIMVWTNWVGAFMLLVVGAGLCLFVARVLERDDAESGGEPHLIRLVDLMARIQFAATCIAVGGLLALGRFAPDAFGGQNKWAAVNVLLCTAIGLALLSGFAIAAAPRERAA